MENIHLPGSHHVSVNFVTVRGVMLEVKRYPGETEKPTLIFLHEGLGCIDMWRDFPARLSHLTGCPALVYSRQGYGRSDPCDVPRPLSYMHNEALDVLPALIKAEGINAHVLIGHSDGGSIALINAGGAPALGLRGLITMAAHVFCETLTVTSIAEAKQFYEKGDLRSRLQKYHGNNVDCAFWGWNKAWLDPEFLFWNIEEYLPKVALPLLVMQGADDQYGTLAQVEAIQKKSVGSAQVCILDACGHTPYKEQTAKCLQACVNFLKRL